MAQNTKYKIDVDKLKKLFDDNPKKKKLFQSLLDTDRQTVSKILNKKRKILADEFITAIVLLDKNPMDFALEA